MFATARDLAMTGERSARRSLRTQIREAFADTPVPAGLLAPMPYYDGTEGTEEFFGKKWTSLDDVEFLRLHCDALFFFTDGAFRYYLPAFMLAVLDHPRTSDRIGSTVISTLTRSESEDADSFRKRVDGFSIEQRCVIAQFISHLAHVGGQVTRREPNQALNRYWRKWLP